MDHLNVFVKSGDQIGGILLPMSCSYGMLVDKIYEELHLDKMSQTLAISYEIDKQMALVKVNNDNSMLFYISLRMKDDNPTSYPLCVDVTTIPVVEGFIHGDDQCSSEDINRCNMSLAQMLKLSEKCATLPTVECFALSLPDVSDDVDDRIVEGHDTVVVEVAIDNVEVGRIFKDKNLLKTTVALYAIENNFQFAVFKSDKREYVLKCVDIACKWRFRAVRMGKTDLFKIQYIRFGHTCSVDATSRNHRQAKSSFIADCIKHKYMSPKSVYTLVDIVHDMSHQFRLNIPYGKAWRAREQALEEVMGDPSLAYRYLPKYLQILQDKNSGSVTYLDVDGSRHFKYVFMALGASISGWKYCKPIVVVDGTFLTGKYGGTLFIAYTHDANNNIVILAFGVGDLENNDAWNRFIARFKEAYGVRDDMVFVSDRHPSIENAVANIYPNAEHGVCAFHLKNLKSKFGNCGNILGRVFNAAARAHDIEI